MENRITKILDKFNKAYTIDEEGCILIETKCSKDTIGGTIEFDSTIKVEIVDEELGIMNLIESVTDPKTNEVIQETKTCTIIESFLQGLLENCLDMIEDR